MLLTSTLVSKAAQAEDQDLKDRQRIEELREQRAVLARSKAEVATQINALEADDEALSDAIKALDDESDVLLGRIYDTRRDLEKTKAVVSAARQKTDELNKEIENIRAELQHTAVEAFILPTSHIVNQYATESLSDSAIKFYLLEYVIGSEVASTKALRIAESQLELEQNRAAEQQRIARELESENREDFDDLQRFREDATSLRAVYQDRIADWEEGAAQVEQDDLKLVSEIASLEAAIRARERKRLEQEAEARRRAIEAERKAAEARDGPFLLSVWPARGRITSGFGLRRHPIFGGIRAHNGIDIDGDRGDPVLAARSGEVLVVGYRGGYGKTIVISHGLGYSTLYAHLNAYNVSVGDLVTSGDRIGSLGSTGWSTGPHLHFEMRIDGRAVDPMPYLPP